ncbi:NAD(P)H-binding protein [Nocardia brasiliensis]|uniref:NAD(P)H-binding protein n=1 Tax=Nocardia brasiliensis TaxID=37326 RepID=A0A6G9XNF3_NOCBR|nr:NAD(P)H-binding protein [Nocardia brasiliensis]QIS02373.1 NAD(P)H-binding protein [Nocardia brasiliensis]
MQILVTGATGNIGRKVVDHLVAAGAPNVRALTNNPARAALPAGVEVVEGYLGRVSSLPAAFEGVDRMYLAPLLDTVDEVVALAEQAGVKQIVDLSGEAHWTPIVTAVENSGIDWTHLFTGDFIENSTIWADQIRASDEIRDPFPEVASMPITMDDIARVAAAVLLSDGHTGRTYELTGPQALTRAERVQQIGTALGRRLTVRKVPREEAIQIFARSMGDGAEWYVDTTGSMVGWQPEPTGTVAELTGSPATTFASWAAANTAAFA